jgi:hypothetical protein
MSAHNLVVVSDLHCGCQTGLCPPRGVVLDEGGTYYPSAIQEKIWEYWRFFWDEWVPKATEGEAFDVVVNGDAIDGSHHRSTHQFTHNPQTQTRCAKMVLEPEVARAEKYYHIRGTEVHVGSSGHVEEGLARDLGATQSPEGMSSRYELWKKLKNPESDDDYLVHILHHIGTTSSAAYEATAPQRELINALSDAGRCADRPPDAVVRSHRHRYIKTEIPSHRGRAISLTTPAWQGKTPYTFRKTGARQQQPQFGGVLLRVGSHGYLDERHWVVRLKRSPAEE